MCENGIRTTVMDWMLLIQRVLQHFFKLKLIPGGQKSLRFVIKKCRRNFLKNFVMYVMV
jgi:hypothetical protein